MTVKKLGTENGKRGTAEWQNGSSLYGSLVPDPGSRFSTGFTLLELLIVIVILSLVVMIVVPRLPSTGSSSLRSSASALAATLRYLEETSITSKTWHRLHLNISENSLRITRRLQSGDELPPDDQFLARKILDSRIVITDVETSRLGKVTEGEVLVDFNAAGLTEFLTIHLKAGPGKELTVVGFPSSGKVKILEGYQEFTL